MQAGMDQLVTGLGDVNDAPTDATIVGGLQLLQAGSDQLFDGTGELVDGVLGGLSLLRGGFTNPEFTQEQDELGGLTPKEYYQDCPACFDPSSAKFDPATADPAFQPSLLEVFTLFSEGIRDALPELQSFVNEEPGLVEGLQQIVDGLDEMAKGLQTFDAKDPGLVEGLDLIGDGQRQVEAGLQQVSQGLFATNELGVRTTRGQIGDQGDDIARQQAMVKQGGEDAHKTGALGEKAEYVTTTYVFEMPGQSTGTRDNAVRGGLAAFSAAGLLMLWWRPRMVP
jgi:X-X-X-Leu-X-X-Gly heptad repeat protein